MSDSEAVKKIVVRTQRNHEEFMKSEYYDKLQQMATSRPRNYHNHVYKEGDMVFYQLHDGKNWHGLT